MTQTKGNVLALLPLVVFLGLFIGTGVITGDFYKLPILVAALIAAGTAIAMNRKDPLMKKVERFATGAGHPDIMIMVFIFILAGAFSATAKGMGAVESTVNLGLSVLPQSLLVAGLFIIGGFISLSMGTSVGTIAALGPIGVGISQQTDLSMALTMGAIIGGAMFGDNLSIISDTTIASVRTQKTEMKDKFKTNFFIVLPAAIITVLVLIFITLGNSSTIEAGEYNWIKMLPYISVLIAALIGMNVLAILAGGIILSGAIGLIDGSYTLSTFTAAITEGIAGMAELIILTMTIGGMIAIITHNGGIKWILDKLTRNIKSKKGAEFGIAGLVSLTNISTANNTIAIITAGPLAKNIADQYDIDNRKSASLLDIFSCSVQGLIPYGAQMLTAAGLASISPLSIIPYAFYPILIAVFGSIAILIGFPRFKNAKQEAKEKQIAMKESYTNK